jgi:hypothetical protein
MNLTEIEREFESVAAIRGGVCLLSGLDAMRFIEQCERHGVDIEGIEGFKMYGERIQPWQEHSMDLQGKREGNQSIAKEFIQSRLNCDLWFEVVTSDRSP